MSPVDVREKTGSLHDRQDRAALVERRHRILGFLDEDLRHIVRIVDDVAAPLAPLRDVRQQFGVCLRPDGNR